MDKAVLSRFIRGVFSTSTGVIAQIILGFLGFMIVVRFVPKGELGIYILIEAIYTFFGLLSSLTLENISVTRFIASADDSDKIDIANAAMSFKVIISLLIGLTILLCKPLIYPIFKNELLSKFLIYVPLLFILSALNDFLFRIQQGFHQY
jgi:O-antigen/teichoic acid export membrane protein